MSERIDIERFKTKNDNVFLVLEKIGDSYSIYLDSFGRKIEFIIHDSDLSVMNKYIAFLVESYNEGFIDGKNQAFMFGM